MKELQHKSLLLSYPILKTDSVMWGQEVTDESGEQDKGHLLSLLLWILHWSKLSEGQTGLPLINSKTCYSFKPKLVSWPMTTSIPVTPITLTDPPSVK